MYEDMTFVTYRDEYFEGTTHQLVDVRTVAEYLKGHVPGAVNIPLDQLPDRLSEVADDKPVVVICASGNRSQKGATIIKDAREQRVYNLQGGTMIWMMNGLQLEA